MLMINLYTMLKTNCTCYLTDGNEKQIKNSKNFVRQKTNYILIGIKTSKHPDTKQCF